MGKKKKSKKSKLLKMSDEERARYFQHKAEQEEEAKRRREQLVKAWMIKKMKKEQAFSRLNLAKINTYWIQFFRKIKVKEMRDEIKYLQEWLDYILTLKNRIINNLLIELQEAESQYSYNFKAHCVHIDKFIDFHKNWVSELQNLFDEDRYEMTELYLSNMEEYKRRSHENEDYLKTIIFAQGKNAEVAIREDYEYFMKRNYEIIKNVSIQNEESIRHMITIRDAACASLWRRMAQSVRQYVRRTDARRHHMAELRKLDAESATEISDNQERITKLENSIEQLKKHFNNSSEDSKLQLQQMKNEEKRKNMEVVRKRKDLKKSNENDNRKITILTTTSNNSIEHLNRILRTVEHCLFLYKACRKYETSNENLNKWLNKKIGLKYPYFGLPQVQEAKMDAWEEQDDDLTDDFVIEGTKLFSRINLGQLHFQGPKILIDTKKIISRIFPAKKATSKRSSAPSKLLRRSGKIRPETSVSYGSKVSSTSQDLFSDKPQVSNLSKVLIQAKPSVSSSASLLSTPSKITEEDEEDEQKDLDFIPELDVGIGHLEKLNYLWDMKSKVIVDIKELKGEKNQLRYENEQLKHMLRLVLEAAALRRGDMGNDTDSCVTSSGRGSFSATLRTAYDQF
ncbi:dynein regulatory complex subunit 2-like [Coccinella septempunctata]|uniref:dynein regulatory complex subunit 2-like n=1 Tax=Coccinella septempunctata TaxID=41139 RepID=UPI001D05D706|nr:dynein regulatory complex subunit 2-like [Coccinella septempunctata]